MPPLPLYTESNSPWLRLTYVGSNPKSLSIGCPNEGGPFASESDDTKDLIAAVNEVRYAVRTRTPYLKSMAFKVNESLRVSVGDLSDT